MPRGLAAALDRTLLVCFLGLALVHAIFLLALRSMDFPRRIEPDVVPDRFAEYIPDLVDPKQPLDLKALGEVGEKARKKVDKPLVRVNADRGEGPGCGKACQEARAASRRTRLAEQISRMGVLRLLGSKGKGGTVSNLIGPGGGSAAADKAFSGVSGITVSGHSASRGLKASGGGSGSTVGIGDLGGEVGGPGAVGVGGNVRERLPDAVVRRAPPQIAGTIDAEAVTRTIRRGMRAVKGCYQRALKVRAGLTGKITVRITLNAMGVVVKVEIEEDSLDEASVTACIKSHVKRWRFSTSEDRSEVSVPFVFRPAE